MIRYWTPSNISFIATATAQLIVSVSTQREGLALFVNADTTVGFISFATASATVGEFSKRTPLLPGASFFIAFAHPFTAVHVASASVYAQAGYSLK